MKWNIDNIKEWTWKEHPIGAIMPEAGNSIYYETGGWRALRPIRDTDKCNHCLICFIYCPEGCISVKDGKITGFDLAYCKGCGICAHECPKKAIEMIPEVEAKQREKQGSTIK